MIKEKLEALVHQKHLSLLGVGPMSLNCVDAAIELANEFESPLMMIASRRQIDSEDFGGGYVNQWSTDRYASYVMDNDKKGRIILARDHGGPWQSEIEVKKGLSLKRAMDSAKDSFSADIDAGFQILHIDPSIDIHGSPSVEETLDRAFELYEFCWSYAKSKRKEIAFEIGTEEQSGITNSQEELDYTLGRINSFCDKNKYPRPAFVVVQTGTRVMEMRNIGSLDNPFRVVDEIPAEIQVPKMVEICKTHGVLLKEHNADYLSDEILKWHPRLGIHAANVAPEFGVAESKAFASLLEENSLNHLADDFYSLSFSSKKWEKWMLDGSSLSDKDKAIISGHYVFSNPSFNEIKRHAEKELSKKNIKLDNFLKNAVKRSIYRYMKSFGLAK
jgi:fructose/tagatose bisphosphate aldolase